MGAAPGPIPAPFHTPLDPQGALASANGHRGVPRADAGAGTPGRGRRRKRDARTTGDARDEPRRDRGAGPANPRGRVRRDDAPGGGKGETTPRGGDGSRKGDHRGRSGGHRGRFPLEPGHTASNLRDTPQHTHTTPPAPRRDHTSPPSAASLSSTHTGGLRRRRGPRAPRGPLPRHAPHTTDNPRLPPGNRPARRRTREAGDGRERSIGTKPRERRGCGHRSGRTRETTTTTTTTDHRQQRATQHASELRETEGPRGEGPAR